MSKLLSDRIRDLHLRPDAPYPSEVVSAHDFIRRWRHEQRLRTVRPVVDVDPDGTDYPDVDPGAGEQG